MKKTAITILFAIAILAILNTYFKIYIIEIIFPPFPYNPNVWGNVSDWVMIGVTGLTAWFLWKTLKSQTHVQKIQERLAQIEIYNHKENIKPSFEIKIISREDRTRAAKIGLTVKNADAKSVKFQILSPKINNNIGENIRVSIAEGVEISFDLFPDDREFPLLHAIITITFSDVDGNKYRQSVTYSDSLSFGVKLIQGAVDDFE